MNLRTLMHGSPTSILSHVPISAARPLMKAHGLCRLPVVDGRSRLLGALCIYALLRCATGMEGPVWQSALVQDLCVPEPAVASLRDRPEDVAALMVQHRRSSIAVVDNGRLVGIVTYRSLTGCVLRG